MQERGDRLAELNVQLPGMVDNAHVITASDAEDAQVCNDKHREDEVCNDKHREDEVCNDKHREDEVCNDKHRGFEVCNDKR